jgi:signal transduction histidine kinase
VAGGDLDQHLPEGEEPRGRDELVNVAREFDKMIRSVKARTADLERAAEREREDAEQLRELDRVKNLLLQAVSHDLRSPITSVLGSARMLERADELDLGQDDRDTLARGLSSSARKMNRLVEDILDIDRLERGIIAPRRQMTDMAALVSEVAPDAAVAGTHTLHVETTPVSIAVDAPKVERIVDNLVSNAMKYTPRGTDIWVRVAPIPGGALIVVEDAGPGVPDQIKETIFEPFTQGDPEARVPGVGVGLSLVARFAELHGGRAWVEDRDGGGASFHVELADGPVDMEDDADETYDR